MTDSTPQEGQVHPDLPPGTAYIDGTPEAGATYILAVREGATRFVEVVADSESEAESLAAAGAGTPCPEPKGPDGEPIPTGPPSYQVVEIRWTTKVLMVPAEGN